MTEITFEDLHLQRGSRGGSGFHLGPLTMTIPGGARTALVGPSGCGKTTLLRVCAGLERPTRGRVRLGGELATDQDRLVLPPQSRGIGFVFQDGALWPHLDAVAHLRFADPALDRRAATAALARVGLADKAGRRPHELSGGERQRLALARALVGSPRLLLLDEPLHSVDTHLRGELAMLIADLATERRLTLVLVTHDRQEALAIAEHVAVLRDGKLVEQGRATDLLRAPKTAFTASFLAGATCLPCRDGDGGNVQNDFGSWPRPFAGDVQLVLLPQDAVLDDTGPAAGRVLQVGPSAHGAVATVQVAGNTVQVAATDTLQPGAQVRLALRGRPRLLPEANLQGN